MLGQVPLTTRRAPHAKARCVPGPSVGNCACNVHTVVRTDINVSAPYPSHQPAYETSSSASGITHSSASDAHNEVVKSTGPQPSSSLQHDQDALLEPHQLTARITGAQSLAELNDLVGPSVAQLNAIHIAAAIVKAAKLYATASELDPSSAESRLQPGASTSQCGTQNVYTSRQNVPGPGHVPAQGILYSARDFHNHLQNSYDTPFSSLPHSNCSAQQMVEVLGDRFLQLAGSGQYPLARHHANITWALGKLGYRPDSNLVSSVVQQLVEDSNRRMRSGIPQELSNIAYGLARLGYHHHAVWDALSTIAKGQLSAFKPQELSNLAWAAAKANKHDQGDWRPLLTELGAAALTRVADFKPRELVNLMWSFAKSRHAAPALFAVATQQLVQHAALTVADLAPSTGSRGGSSGDARQRPTGRSAQHNILNCQDVANAAWACAKSGHHDAAFMDSMANVVLTASAAAHLPTAKRPPALRCFHGQELSSLMWAFATLDHVHVELMHAMAAELARRANSLNPQSISNSMWAAAKLGLSGQAASSFVRSMLVAAAAQTHDFSPQEISNLLWAAVTLSRDPQQQQRQRCQDVADTAEFTSGQQLTGHESRLVSMLRPVISAVRWKADSMQPAALAQVAWAGAQLRGADDNHLALVAAGASVPQLGDFGPQELSILLHSLARQQHVDPLVFQAAGDTAAQHAASGALSATGLAKTLWAFARSKQSHRQLPAAAACAATSKLEQFTLVEVANLLWALASLHYRDKVLLDRAAKLLLQGTFSLVPPSTRHAPESALSSSSSSSTADSSSRSHGHGHGSDREAGLAAAVMAWSFARSRYHHSQLYDWLADAVLPHVSSLPSANLAKLVWAFAAHDHQHRQLLDAVAQELAARLQREVGQMIGPKGQADLAAVASSPDGLQALEQLFAGYRSAATAAAQASERALAVHPKDIALVAWAYAKLQHNSPPLFTAVLHSALLYAEVYELRVWSRLARAYSTLCLPAEELFFARLQLLLRAKRRHMQREREEAEEEEQHQQRQRQQQQAQTARQQDSTEESAHEQGQGYRGYQPRFRGPQSRFHRSGGNRAGHRVQGRQGRREGGFSPTRPRPQHTWSSRQQYDSQANAVAGSAGSSDGQALESVRAVRVASSNALAPGLQWQEREAERRETAAPISPGVVAPHRELVPPKPARRASYVVRPPPPPQDSRQPADVQLLQKPARSAAPEPVQAVGNGLGLSTVVGQPGSGQS